MPGPTFQTSGTNFDGATTSTPQFPAPSGVAANDIVIIAFYTDGITVTVSTPPSGFSYAGSSPVPTTGAPSGQHTGHVFWKRATGGGEPATYDFTLSGSTFVEGRAHRYSGCKSSGSPFDTTTNAIDISGTTALNVGPLTSPVDNSMFIHSSTDWSGGSWTPSSGFTERQDGSVGLVQMSEKAQATAGSSGTVAATCTNSDKQTAWLGVLVPDSPAGSQTPWFPPELFIQILAAASESFRGQPTQTTADSGTATAGGATYATAVKVAPQSGRACAGGVGKATAVKVAPESGRVAGGAATSGVEVKKAVESGTAAGGGFTSGVASSFAIKAQSGTSFGGMSGSGVEVKVAVESGRSIGGLTGRAVAAKIAPEAGRSSGGVATRAVAQKVAIESGSSFVGPVGRATSVKKAPQTGRSALGPAGYGTQVKKAPQSGRSYAGLIGFGPAPSSAAGAAFLLFFM